MTPRIVLAVLWLMLALATVVLLTDLHSVEAVTVTFIAWFGGILTVLTYFEWKAAR